MPKNEHELLKESELLRFTLHIYEYAHDNFKRFPSAKNWRDANLTKWWYQQALQDLNNPQTNKRMRAEQAISLKEIMLWLSSTMPKDSTIAEITK
ncbi:MAG: hypothetical protein Unbinned400contig1002_8 [Prokaryotic dsDNA virus sp.]|nr:MAG: hypothetical protein Unbinned400contig1002_8 [Prokaryotic dsDNA virus sp.]|tara:strand:+ start:2290 stop:2574 length:285 start_codon:yes stop_codon:yes gene_type:complete